MESKPSTSPSSFVDQQVFPGDVVLDLSKMANQTIKLGGGLRQDGDVISVMKAGKLRFSKPNKYWVESSHKRYVPSAGDNVLGIVVDAKADNFVVDIKGPTLAFLPVLAFEGGTRRNIPKFEVNIFCLQKWCLRSLGMILAGGQMYFNFFNRERRPSTIYAPIVLCLGITSSALICAYDVQQDDGYVNEIGYFCHLRYAFSGYKEP